MPIRRASMEVVPALMADEFIVTGFQVRKYDKQGDALDRATVTLYWVKRLGGVRVDHGALSIPLPSEFDVTTDETLQGLGVFPAG